VVALALVPGALSAQSSSPAGPHVSDAAIVRDLGQQLRQLSVDSAFSGTVLFARDGKILFQGAAGYADRVSRRLNTSATPFNLGSLGKAFTAVAVLQLAQARKLSLDDAVSAVLPDYPNATVARTVTVRQLLEHTSGLGDVFTEDYLVAPSHFCDASTYLPLFARDTSRFAPGSSWRYSNAGYMILGLIVERLSGQSFAAYVQDHVFRPAGMSSSGGYDKAEHAAARAIGYTTRRGLGPPTPGDSTHSNAVVLPDCGSPAGGGYSTVADLLRFDQAIRKHGLLNAEYTRLLLTGAVAQDVRSPEAKYTLGLEEVTVNGVRSVGHGGSFPGVSSIFDTYPELGYTIIVLSNADNGIQPVSFRLRWILRGQAATLPALYRLAPSALSAFAGSYVGAEDEQGSGTGSPMRVTADSTGLILDMGARRAKRRFLPIGEAEFADRDLIPLRLTFAKDANGAVVGLAIVGVGPTTTAKKIP
jgi:CubicO group peptidase (beta-lactamase class C family)